MLYSERSVVRGSLLLNKHNSCLWMYSDLLRMIHFVHIYVIDVFISSSNTNWKCSEAFLLWGISTSVPFHVSIFPFYLMKCVEAQRVAYSLLFINLQKKIMTGLIHAWLTAFSTNSSIIHLKAFIFYRPLLSSGSLRGVVGQRQLIIWSLFNRRDWFYRYVVWLNRNILGRLSWLQWKCQTCSGTDFWMCRVVKPISGADRLQKGL